MPLSLTSICIATEDQWWRAPPLDLEDLRHCQCSPSLTLEMTRRQTNDGSVCWSLVYRHTETSPLHTSSQTPRHPRAGTPSGLLESPSDDGWCLGEDLTAVSDRHGIPFSLTTPEHFSLWPANWLVILRNDWPSFQQLFRAQSWNLELHFLSISMQTEMVAVWYAMQQPCVPFFLFHKNLCQVRLSREKFE